MVLVVVFVFCRKHREKSLGNAECLSCGGCCSLPPELLQKETPLFSTPASNHSHEPMKRAKETSIWISSFIPFFGSSRRFYMLILTHSQTLVAA